MRGRLPFIFAAIFSAIALLFACTGKDPDPITEVPDTGAAATSSSSSTSSGGASSSSGQNGGEAGPPPPGPGTLDTSFGDAGVISIDAVTDGGAFARAVTLTSDAILIAAEATNKVDLVYEPEVVKLDFSGKLATSFGTGGIATTSSQGLDTHVYSIATDKDGNIGVGETQDSYGHPAVFNVTAAGGDDTSKFLEASEIFGRVTSALSGPARYLGGDYDAQDDLRIWKLTSTGGVDKVLKLPPAKGFSTFPAVATRMRRDVNGRIVVAANTSLAEDLEGIVAARFKADETGVDGTFGNSESTVADGVFFHPLPGKNPVTVSIDRLGMGWVLAANIADTASANILLLKIGQDGNEVDTTFGANGQVVDFDGDETANDMITDGAGLIYLAGYRRRDDDHRDGFVVRRLPDGKPDKTFGNAGLFTLPFANWQAEAIVLQSDGRLLVAGTSFDAGLHAHGFVARVLP